MDDLFKDSELVVLVPGSTPPQLPIPFDPEPTKWLHRVLDDAQNARAQVFYDEALEFFFAIRFPSQSADTSLPSSELLKALCHIQPSLDASYISPMSHPTKSVTPPIRTFSLNSVPSKSRLPPSHATSTNLPPSTPHPVPHSTESDIPYLHSEGTVLYSGIWGQRNGYPNSDEDFTLFRDPVSKAWTAVYKFHLLVSYLPIPITNPLLCLTVSATLRDRPTCAEYIQHVLKSNLDQAQLDALTFNVRDLWGSHLSSSSSYRKNRQTNRAVEPNLLQGLASAPTFTKHDAEDNSLWLPSSRIGAAYRRQAFPYPPDSSEIESTRNPTPSPSNVISVLRRSYRKTLNTLSAFHLRLLPLCVPYMTVPGSQEQELDAGLEEQTVILCVEIDTMQCGGSGFTVESVDLKVAGHGAVTRVIPWNGSFSISQATQIFPLNVLPREQYNLLYAVSFSGTDPSVSSAVLGKLKPTFPSASDVIKVAIVVHGRPFMTVETSDDKSIVYQSNAFASRWSTSLNLRGAGATGSKQSLTLSQGAQNVEDVLPIPPSPFPSSSGFRDKSIFSPQRASLPLSLGPIRELNSPAPYTIQNKPLPPVRDRSSAGSGVFSPMSETHSPAQAKSVIPRTPAWPAFPTATSPPVMAAFSPIKGLEGNFGSPITPFHEDKTPVTPQIQSALPSSIVSGHIREPLDAQIPSVIVAVRLLAGKDFTLANRGVAAGEVFALDIFVFNESQWTRRFEVGHSPVFPQHSKRSCQFVTKSSGRLSILPLETRIRVGPLLPETCQSVQMRFLALEPGIHTIDNLTLTDVHTGHVVYLRSVIDVFVWDSRQ